MILDGEAATKSDSAGQFCSCARISYGITRFLCKSESAKETLTEVVLEMLKVSRESDQSR